MNLEHARIGLLTTPVTPLWSGTVASYDTTHEQFELTVTTVTGALTAVVAGMAVQTAQGDLVRVKAVNTSTGVLTLAQNGVSFTAGDAIAVYNCFYPMPRYYRGKMPYIQEAGDTYNQVGWWALTHVDENNSHIENSTVYWALTNQSGTIYVDLYASSDEFEHDESRVAQGTLAPGVTSGTVTLHDKHNSKIEGTVEVAYTQDDTDLGNNVLTVLPLKLMLDYTIKWEDLGTADIERSRAIQAPVPIVTPNVTWASVNTNFVLDASASFATYYGYGEYPGSRDLASIYSYSWSVLGTSDYTITGGTTSATLTIHFHTAGFYYIKLTITDQVSGSSQHVQAIRYIPIWVAGTPRELTRCDLSFGLGRGWQAELEVYDPDPFLRHSLVAVVDLDTREVVFMGFTQSASLRYDREKAIWSLTALSDLAYLQNVYSYLFQLIGVKGAPVDWNNFDMLSFPRGIYFILRWFCNYLELANVQFDTDPDNRLQAVINIAPGDILDQINVITASAKYAIYGGRTGGLEAIDNLLDGSTVTGASYDAITKTLGAGDVAAPAGLELGENRVSSLAANGFYYDVNLDVYAAMVYAPLHPGPYGKPSEQSNLWASTVAELQNWTAREMALANTAAGVDGLRVLVDVDPAMHKMIDLPDLQERAAAVIGAPLTDANHLIRVVVESESLRFNPQALDWQETVSGKSFGGSSTSGQGPG